MIPVIIVIFVIINISDFKVVSARSTHTRRKCLMNDDQSILKVSKQPHNDTNTNNKSAYVIYGFGVGPVPTYEK